MRALLFLLFLANLLFFAWTQGYLGTTGSPDAARLGLQLQPERLRIVARGEPPAEKPPAPAAEQPAAPPSPPAGEAAVGGAEAKDEKKTTGEIAPPALACRQWPNLRTEDADRLTQFLADSHPEFKVTRATASALSYWVYIPPLGSRQEADRKVAELKKIGVPELFVVQEAGPNRLAISLGIFSTAQAAGERLEALRGKGVRSARVGERKGEGARVAIEAEGPADRLPAVREAVAGLLPEISGTTCPARQP